MPARLGQHRVRSSSLAVRSVWNETWGNELDYKGEDDQTCGRKCLDGKHTILRVLHLSY